MSAVEQRKAAVLAYLRGRPGWARSRDIAAAVGVHRRLLTGNSVGALLLLEVEGLVERTGAKKGCRWRTAA